MQLALRISTFVLVILSVSLGLIMVGVIATWGASPMDAPFLYLAVGVALIGPAFMLRLSKDRLPFACAGSLLLIGVHLMLVSFDTASYVG